MNRTLLDECFRIQGRTKWYTSPDDIQGDFDTFMAFYNFRRTHQGYRVAGRTPAKALFDLIAQSRPLPPIPPALRRWRWPADPVLTPPAWCRGKTRLVHASEAGATGTEHSRVPWRRGHLLWPLQLPRHTPGLQSRRPDARQSHLRSHRPEQTPATHVARPQWVGAGQLIWCQPPRTGCRGRFDLYIRPRRTEPIRVRLFISASRGCIGQPILALRGPCREALDVHTN